MSNEVKMLFAPAELEPQISSENRSRLPYLAAAGLLFATGAALITNDVSHAQAIHQTAENPSDWIEIVRGAINIIDIAKWPLIVGAGGAIRVHGLRKNEFSTIESNLGALQQRLSALHPAGGERDGGIFSRGKSTNQPTDQQRAQTENMLKYYANQKELYEKEGLHRWGSKEQVREFSEGVILAFGFEAFPTFSNFLIDLGIRAQDLYKAGNDIAVAEATKAISGAVGMTAVYTALIWNFFKIQNPGGRIGSLEEAQAKKNGK